MQRWGRFSNWFDLLRVFVWLLPLIPLFRLGYGYYHDWYVNLWMLDYNARYFLDHLQFPDVYHANDTIGMPTPIFYGPLFYKLGSLVVAICGAPIGMRVLIALATGLQFVFLYRFLNYLTRNSRFSLLVCTFFSWGIYTLTNLYNRSAVAEFFGIQFLTIALVQLFYLMVRNEFRWKSLTFWSLGFFFALTMGTHTLTGAMGGLFLLFVSLLFLPLCKEPKKWLLGFFLQGILILITMSPWLYTQFKFGPYLNVITRTREMFTDTTGIDLWWARFSPWPVDPRHWIYDLRIISTPFLTAQLSVGLFLFCGYMLYRLRDQKESFTHYRFLVGGGFLLTCFTFFISTYPGFWDWVPASFAVVQFSYRIVTYINLAMLVLLVGLVLVGRRAKMSFEISNLVFWGLLVLSLPGAIGKIIQSQHVAQDREYKETIAELPREYNGRVDFGVWYFYERPDFDAPGVQAFGVKLIPWHGVGFGTVLDGTVNSDSEKMIVTNVLAFPWNLVLMDAENAKLFMRGYYAGVTMPKGEHRLSYMFAPPVMFYVWRNLSTGVFFSWGGALLVVFLRRRRKAKNEIAT